MQHCQQAHDMRRSDYRIHGQQNAYHQHSYHQLPCPPTGTQPNRGSTTNYYNPGQYDHMTGNSNGYHKDDQAT